MDAKNVRVGVLLSPTIPLWSGTVVSYIAGESFLLEVTPKTGITSALVGWFVDLSGKFVRIRAVNVSGANAILTLAPNGLSFTAANVVNIYNVIYPAPKYQRTKSNVVTWDGGVAGQFRWWRFTNTGGFTTLYWEIDASKGNKLILYSDSDRNEDSKVASNGNILGSHGLTPKNNSGVQGEVYINDLTPGSGSLTITPYILYKDFDITWASLGANDDARNKASQGPVIIVNPECVNADLGENFTLSAVGSFATYDGSNVPGTIRYPATIAAMAYVWAPGAGGTVHSGQNSPTAVISYSTPGFRYLLLTVTDSNGTAQVRKIPVWAGVTPYPVESASIPWHIDEDLSIELEFKSPPAYLRHTLVCLVDLDTRECLYMGYAWPASLEYDYEKSTLKLTAYQTLSFLRSVFYYPFIITGIKGGAISWDYFDMYSAPRGAYFLLRWHSNFLDIANAQFDVRTINGPPVSPPGALAAENRLRYIQGFSAGTLYDEIKMMARQSFYSIYPLPLGGFEVIPSLLYGSTIEGVIPETGVDSDSITAELADADMRVPVQTQYATPSMSELTVFGFYHKPNLDVLPIRVKAPTNPEPYGRPAEIPDLLASPILSEPSDPGYFEIIRWAGRHVGLANYANTYTVRPILDMVLKNYKMVDIPNPLNPSVPTRIVIEQKTVTFHPIGYADIEIVGRDFGVTVNSVVAPLDPVPTTPPIIDPIPIPEPPEVIRVAVVMTNNQIGLSLNAYEDEPTEWTNLVVDDLAGPNVGDFYTLVISTATGRAWLLTGVHVVTNLGDNGLWYCSNIFSSSPSFSLVLSHNAWAALCGFAAGSKINALGCDDNGIAYITGSGAILPGNSRYAHGSDSMSVATPGSFPTVGNLPIVYSQYAISSGAVALGSFGAGGVPAHGIQTFDGGTATWLYWDSPESGGPNPSDGFFRWGAGLYSYAAGYDSAVLVYSGVSNEGPIMANGANVLTVRASDGDLMGGAVSIYSASDIFGAGRSIGWYCFGAGDSGALLAIASNGNVPNHFISLLPGGEFVWVDKSGDWVEVMGANYGGNSGAGYGYPVIATTELQV